ncbi:hypothetical protein [Pseudomonas donghuensis]|uniref:hypothetical protein n=1 Tax=Pseudomonas donghuensis TaxID=1163398 RepID=UPI001FD59768|nr:hypothetical protein [Pseudomonas donghuensis]
MNRAHHLPGLLLSGVHCAGAWRAAHQGSTQHLPPEERGTVPQQTDHKSVTALLCNAASIDTLKIKSLCCAAAGIISPVSSTTEGLIPHGRLRQAAPADTTLIASDRPHAQPAKGYKHPGSI